MSGRKRKTRSAASRCVRITAADWKRYAGKDVAMVDGRIVAAGRTSVEAFNKARQLLPDRKPEEIVIHYVRKQRGWTIYAISIRARYRARAAT